MWLAATKLARSSERRWYFIKRLTQYGSATSCHVDIIRASAGFYEAWLNVRWQKALADIGRNVHSADYMPSNMLIGSHDSAALTKSPRKLRAKIAPDSAALLIRRLWPTGEKLTAERNGKNQAEVNIFGGASTNGSAMSGVPPVAQCR